MFLRFSIISAAIFGLTGVALGAFGAHALHGTSLANGTLNAWKTGVHYQMVHAVALICVASMIQSSGATMQRYLAWAARFWVAGVILFSGSLYILALGGPQIFGPITPLGGVAFILGWIYILIAGLKYGKD
jgi:uncharacterized membrane protein YgdD (TMEM256/DUF423 family)